MKTIPNYISFSRIIFSLSLLAVEPLSPIFYAIYLYCGLSDVLDGFIARRTGTQSDFGAKLDSVADFLMVGVLLIVLYPVLDPTVAMVIWIIFIGMIRFTSMAVVMNKYKTIAMLHTYSNKITGMILLIFPLLLPFIHSNLLISLVSTVASISAIEELIIHLTADELQLNKQSIFIK